MFWVHGGGYCLGSSTEYGDIGIANHLVAKGVIVVTINYRLGPFGFFTTGDDHSAGNFGLWDQTFALQWVREHIAAFNGDPDKITVFGESAGAASTDFLMLSPHSRDLFKQSIIMSAAATTPWSTADTKAHSIALATQLKCPITSSEAVLTCLRTKSVEEIEEAIGVLGPLTSDLKLFKFSPNIDGNFLPRNVEKLRQDAPKKRVIAGTTEMEGGLWTIKDGPMLSTYFSSPDFSVSDLKKFINEMIPETRKNFELLRIVATYEYLRKGDFNNHTFIIEKYTQAVGDHLFNVPLCEAVQSMIENDWNVYLYSFDYVNPEAFAPDNPFKRAYHGMEIPYLFKMAIIKSFDFNDEDNKVLRTFTRLFTNFAIYGNPNGKESDTWMPVTKEKRDHYLSISAHPTFQVGFHRSSTTFWTSLVPEIERFEHSPSSTMSTAKKAEL